MSGTRGRRAYAAVAAAFAFGVAVQVFLAGAAIVHDVALWDLHVRGGIVLELGALVLLVVALVARMPARFVVVPVILAFLVMFQYASMSFRPSLVAALHPVNALVLFAASAFVSWSAVSGSAGTDASSEGGGGAAAAPPGGPAAMELGHLRAVAGLSLALGVFGLIAVVYLTGRAAEERALWVAASAVAGVAALAVVAAWGLFRRRRWARVAAFVLAALALVAFPFGTAFGLYAFVGLRRPGVDRLLR